MAVLTEDRGRLRPEIGVAEFLRVACELSAAPTDLGVLHEDYEQWATSAGYAATVPQAVFTRTMKVCLGESVAVVAFSPHRGRVARCARVAVKGGGRPPVGAVRIEDSDVEAINGLRGAHQPACFVSFTLPKDEFDALNRRAGGNRSAYIRRVLAAAG